MSCFIVNLFGQPGAGKSTGAAYIFAMLKMAGVNAELVTEFAKDKTWEDNKEALKNQNYVFGKQSFKISRCADKVDVIVTDSPLLLSAIYDEKHSIALKNHIFEEFNSYDNMNYVIKRVKPYNPVGRNQNEEQSDEIYGKLVNFLFSENVHYFEVPGDIDGYNLIVNQIKEKLKIN